MHHYLLVSVEATSVIFMDFWVLVSLCWIWRVMFLLMLNTMSIGLSLSFSLFRFSGIGICCCSFAGCWICGCCEFEEFVAVEVGITEHPIFLWLHLGLGLTQGHSRPFAETVLWTCCQTGLEHDLWCLDQGQHHDVYKEKKIYYNFSFHFFVLHLLHFFLFLYI